MDVTIEFNSDSKYSKDKPGNAPQAFEDGEQAIVDELKELNLSTSEDPRLIYLSMLLSPSQEKIYFELLLKYKDVFCMDIQRNVRS